MDRVSLRGGSRTTTEDQKAHRGQRKRQCQDHAYHNDTDAFEECRTFLLRFDLTLPLKSLLLPFAQLFRRRFMLIAFMRLGHFISLSLIARKHLNAPTGK